VLENPQVITLKNAPSQSSIWHLELTPVYAPNGISTGLAIFDTQKLNYNVIELSELEPCYYIHNWLFVMVCNQSVDADD